METRDTARGREDSFSPSVDQRLPARAGTPGRASADRLELKRQWVQQADERQAETAAALYEKAALARMHSVAPEIPEQADLDEEALEALSKELKLQQKCQDIAAQILVDELEEDLDD